MTTVTPARAKLSSLVNQAMTLVTGLLPAIKTIGGTVITYRNELDNLVYDAFNHRISSVDMRRAHKALMQQLAPEIIVEGLHEGGLKDDDLDEEDQAWIDEAIGDWLGTQLESVNGFAKDCYAAGDDDKLRADCLDREEMWVSDGPASLRSLGELAKAYAMKSEKAYFRLGNRQKHTADCIRLSQYKPKRLSWWIDSGYTPPIHFGCILPGNEVLIPGDVLFAAKSFYIGRCVEVSSADGHRFTVTANHPILTTRGWVAAGLLKKKDQIINALDREGIVKRINPDNEQMPTMIEDIFCSLEKDVSMMSACVPVSPEDFHGDGREINSNIDIVYSDSLLSYYGITSFEYLIGEPSLSRVHSGLGDFKANSHFHSFPEVDFSTSGGNVGGRDLMGALLFTKPRPYLNSSIPSASDGYSNFLEPSYQDPSSDANLFRKFSRDFSGEIAPSKIIDIRYYNFSGHVYDLHVKPYELYICNYTIVSNCGCALVSVKTDEVIMGE